MKKKIITQLTAMYRSTDNGSLRIQPLVGDIGVLVGLLYAVFIAPPEGLFRAEIQMFGTLCAGLIMLGYSMIWRLVESDPAMFRALSRESQLEVVLRAGSVGAIWLGLFFCGKHFLVFYVAFSLFYVCLFAWNLVVSAAVRIRRGLFINDAIGAVLAVSFALAGGILFARFSEESKPFKSDSVALETFGQYFITQNVLLVFSFGVISGAMVLNGIWAWSRVRDAAARQQVSLWPR